MDNWSNMQDLFEHIRLISEAEHKLNEAAPYGPDILTLTNEDLNELLPGEHNSQHRRDIMGLINMISQEQARQSMDSSPADVMNLASEVPQSSVIFTKLEIEQQLIATQDVNKPNITSEKELPSKGTDPGGEESESDQWI